MDSTGRSSLLQEFTTQQNENAFLRAFSFSTMQLPVDSASEVELADRVVMVNEIGFIFQLMEREQKAASKADDLEKWITNYVVRRGVKQIQNTRDLLRSYMGLSLVNNFGHRTLISPGDPDLLVSVIVYRVPPKTRAFRAARFKKNRAGGFVHILRDAEYFQIVHHFVTPAELTDYFGFRRDILINWDPAAAAVSEAALIGQYLLEEYSSPPAERFESASRSRGGPTACEFSFVLDSLASSIASQESDYADTDFYDVLAELARLARYELRALRQQFRLALEAVRSNRFELPYRIASARGAGFLVLPLTKEFHTRALGALRSLSEACKYELDLDRQIGIGMWRNSEFVDIEWMFLNGRNLPDPDLDERLAHNYPFRRASEQRLPPIFV
ncbi:MAG TPA: hypothetical protein VGO33_15475 [Gemmatimonadaceae bacterium]|nr:hypothetical protein [Gemmatimonadaceae bacterium]